MSACDCLNQVLMSARKEVVIVTQTLTAQDPWQVFVDMSIQHLVFVVFLYEQAIWICTAASRYLVHKHRCCTGDLANICNLVFKQALGRYLVNMEVATQTTSSGGQFICSRCFFLVWTLTSRIWQVCGTNNCLSEFGYAEGSPGLWGEDDDCCTRYTRLKPHLVFKSLLWYRVHMIETRTCFQIQTFIFTFIGSADQETCAPTAR